MADPWTTMLQARGYAYDVTAQGKADRALGKDKKRRAIIEEAKRGLNAEMPFFASPDYGISEDKTEPVVSGVTLGETGDITLFPNNVGDEERMPKVLSHETFHKRGIENKLDRNKLVSSKDPEIDKVLERNMTALKPSRENPIFAANYDQSPEEQLASLFGYEGGLPKGTPITKSEIADKLFSGQDATLKTGMKGQISSQDLKDYYFDKTSAPYGGVWNGQIPDEGILEMLSRKYKEGQRKGFLSTLLNNGS